jgi:neopullulanase
MTPGDLPTPEWVFDAVFYAVTPDRFARAPEEGPHAWDPHAFEPWDAAPTHLAYKGGNLRGVIGHLDDLRELGVNALYLTPIFASITNHRYKTLDHLRVDPILGGEEAFDALLKAAHGRGMRVILDGVFNHVGVGFPAFQDVLAYGERSPWRSWFHIEGWPLNPYDPSRPAHYRCWSDNRSMPELNLGNPGVRAYVLEVIEHWLERGVDGWRFDAPEKIRDVEFWREVRRRARAVRPDAYLLGEVWTDASHWLDGTQWDGATNYGLLYALYRFVAGHRLRDEHLLAPSRGQRPSDAAQFAGDVEHLLQRHPWPIPLAQWQFLSTHDVARFVTAAGGDHASRALGALLLFTLPGVPCIYYGDEVGMEGGLPPASRAGYLPREQWNGAVRAHFRALANLRHGHAALRRGTYRTLHAQGGLLVFERAHAGERLLVAVNTSEAPAAATLDLGRPAPAAIHGAPELTPDAGGWRIGLAPRSGAVLKPGINPGT